MFILLGSLIVSSEGLAKQSLKDVQKERKEVKTKVADSEKELEKLIESIEEIEAELAELNKGLEENEAVLQQVIDEKEEAEEEIEQLEKQIEERHEILKERARAYQENGGNISYIDVLFGAKDFNDFISRVNAANKIVESDVTLMQNQELDKAIIAVNQEQLEELEQEYIALEENIVEQTEEKNAKKEKLEKDKVNLADKVKEYKVKDDELAKMEKKIKQRMKPKSKPQQNNSPVTKGDLSGSGIFQWPTQGGYISSYMGNRNGRLHRGIDIARRDFSTRPPIYAADAGTVESAGYSGSYGNRVVINHHNGYKTLYAHMSSLSVSSGQSVSKGQTLGIMGATGNSTGVHLHFEVTQNGRLVNPTQFLN